MLRKRNVFSAPSGFVAADTRRPVEQRPDRHRESKKSDQEDLMKQMQAQCETHTRFSRPEETGRWPRDGHQHVASDLGRFKLTAL